MGQPAASKEHKHIGITFAILGFIALAVSGGAFEESSGLAVPLLAVGCFMLLCMAAFFTVYAVGVMKRNHELWLRGLDTESAEENG